MGPRHLPAAFLLPAALLAAGPARAASVTVAIGVSTEVAGSCTFTSTPSFDFGTVATPSGSALVSGTLVLVCSAASPWTIRIDQGRNFAAGLRMVRAGGSETLAYQMCADALCNAPLDTTSGPAGVGTGTAQNVTIAARLLPAQAPPPGSYSDTLLVTINY